MKKALAESWQFILNTLSILNQGNSLSWLSPLKIRILYPLTGFIISLAIVIMVLIPNIPHTVKGNKVNLVLVMIGVFAVTTFITKLSNAALLITINRQIEGKITTFLYGWQKLLSLKTALLIYIIVNIVLQAIFLLLNVFINAITGVVIGPRLINIISEKRKGVSLPIQLMMILPIMVSEWLDYNLSRQKAIQLIINTWGRSVIQTYSYGSVVAIFALTWLLFSVLEIVIGKNFFLGMASICVMIVFVFNFTALMDAIYCLAAYRYSVLGKNDVYLVPNIAPYAFKLKNNQQKK